ncbi:MAG TPA: transglutaminase-like domain-containing protein, partial [Tepidiformaceae bacterium]|nr:transglutaminase-like domain-containing protein [Tepidiformaceae bacterium]
MVISAPRLVMSWEEWLTFAAAIVAFVAVAVSLQQANWVTGMPQFAPTVVAGLLIGMVAARTKYYAAGIHLLGLVVGMATVVLLVQGFAEGNTLMDRLADFRVRMVEWVQVVRAGDISNDDLPFVTLAHVLTFLAAYFAAWSIFRWRNAWLAVVPAGIILLTNISFLNGQPSGAFVVFLFGSIILIARLHLQANMDRWKSQGVEYPEFISLSAIQLTVATAAALVIFAWQVPLGNQANAVESVFNAVTKPFSGQSDHLVRLFHNIDSRKGANLHGFGDTLPIQGEVTLGTKQLFEVQSPEPGLLRAASYDVYTGNGWRVGGRDSSRVNARDLAVDADAAAYQARDVSILRVTVKDSESTLLTPGSALAANVDVTIFTAPDATGDIEKIVSRRGLREDDTYNSFGSVSRANETQLRGDSTDYPDWVRDRYLQLPDVPERVAAEAFRIVREAGATTPYDQAKAIEAYLRELPYDLNVISPPPGRDATDFLLFDLRRGYFDYMSTAMAVMLRELGIPARVAVGYVLDHGTGAQTTYEVRKDSAYSWVEVYFPTYGWINFNPTGDRPGGGGGGAGRLGPAEPVESPALGDLFGGGGIGIVLGG